MIKAPPVADLFIDIMHVVNKHKHAMEPGELLSVLIGTSAFLGATAGLSREEIVAHMDDTLAYKDELTEMLTAEIKPIAQA
jgi:hypothetical protein